MRILISNDDGIGSKGLHILAKVFSKKHEIVVIVPDSQRSACSHALSSMYGLCYKKDDRFEYETYTCNGTPADCVKLGVLHILKNPPELVLSGINDGTNLGSDVIYSGTVAAAYEGIYMGIPSIAISSNYHTSEEKLYEISEYLLNNLDRLLALNLPSTSLLNINYPSNQPVKGAKILPLGIHVYNDGFVRHNDGYRLEGVPLTVPEDQQDCDIHWFNNGYITMTPIHNDRNDYKTLERIKGDFK